MNRFQNTTTSRGSLRAAVLAAVACGAVVALPLVACAPTDNGGDYDDAATESSAVQSRADATTTEDHSDMNDGEILGVVKMANEAEVVTSQLAVQKATASEVRDFAQQMIDAHYEADLKVDETAAAAEPASESEMASTLAKEAKAEIETLNTHSGPEFDRAYVEAQVKMHQDVLDTIETELLPDSENPGVRLLLEALRLDVKEHLAQAEQLQEQMAPAA